jgi:type IV secretory pathway component VirB8
MNWHYAKFVFPFFERAWILVAGVIFAGLMLSMLFNIYTIMPAVIQQGLLVKSNELYNKSANITSLRDKPGYSQEIILRKLLKEYIKAREEYNYNQLDKQARHIKNNSAKIVYNNFYKYISTENIDSPILKYKKSAKKIVSNLNISIENNNTAIAKFKATTKTTDEKEEAIEEEWREAKINYQINSPEEIVDQNKSLNFLITSYSSNKLN